MNMISTEMDKSRDVRRGTSRFSRRQINNTNNKKPQKQSRPNLFFGIDGGVNGGGGNFVGLEKTKKEKIRRLSSVNGNQHFETEMGSCCCCCCSDLSSDNRENQCPSHSKHSSSLITNSTTKRFKIPKKFLYDCNVIDHASVPRKLRSAMKKRGRESISPPLLDSKKQNHTLGGVKLHKMDGVKKPKMDLKQGESDWSRKATVSGPITKDEEEVVETLYALAGMFPDGDSMDKNKLSGESIEVKSSAPPETMESPVTEIEVKKEETNSVCHPQTAEIVPSFTIDESCTEAAKHNSLDEPTSQDQSDMPGSKQFHMEPDSSISQMKLNTTNPSLVKSEPDAEKSSCIPGNFHVLSELSSETGLKQPKQQLTNLFEGKPEMAFGVTASESQMTQQHMIKETRKNGLALWPGLSSTVPLGARTPGSSQSSTAKIPAWLDAAMYGPRTCSLEGGSSTQKVLKVTMDRKSMKRCAAHVYISCLIRNLKMQDSKESNLQQPLQLKSHVGLKQTALFYPNNSINRNGINGTIPSSSSGNSATDKNSYEARSGILQPKMLHREPSPVASASGMHTSQRQSFDFLSLLAGGVSMEANNNSSNKVGKAIESLPQHQVRYLHSLPQHQSLMPFSIPPSRYACTSSAYTDQLSTATASQQVQLQLPQYLSNPFCGPPYTSHSSVTKQQQRQQRLWAAQYRPGGTSSVLTQFPSWQNGKPESSTLMPCAQTAIPSHSTVDAIGPKYNTVRQHQQPKIAIYSSLPPARVKRPDHHLPSVYEESKGGFRASGPLPLQTATLQ